MSSDPVRILVVTDHTAATPDLLDAIRKRAEDGPTQFRLLVPNPAPAEWHPFHPERRDKAVEAEQVLSKGLPEITAAAGGPVIGSVSIRHDPMDAIEETIHNEPIDEIILSLSGGQDTPRGIAGWLHFDLPHRLAHLELPLNIVVEEP